MDGAAEDLNDFMTRYRLNPPILRQVILPTLNDSATQEATSFIKSYAFAWGKDVKTDHKGGQLKYTCSGMCRLVDGKTTPCKWKVIMRKRIVRDGKGCYNHLKEIPHGAVYITSVILDHCESCDSKSKSIMPSAVLKRTRTGGDMIKGTSRVSSLSIKRLFNDEDNIVVDVNASFQRKMSREKQKYATQ